MMKNTNDTNSKSYFLGKTDTAQFTLKRNSHHLVIEIIYLKDGSYLQLNFASLFRIHKFGLDNPDVPMHIMNRAVFTYENQFKEEQ